MNVLISPNAFKGTISAKKAAEIISDVITLNFMQVNPLIVPIADGGDGTCQLVTDALMLKEIKSWALNAYGRPISATFGWDKEDGKAYIDVSSASGIGSLNGISLDPTIASTYGTGMLIQKAIALGAKEIVLGLGGSATIDLGIGILAALGIAFLDEKGRALSPFSPNYLSKIQHIQRTPKIPKVKFTFLCDVTNRLFGAAGAIPVFGPQKGLKEDEFEGYESLILRLATTLYGKSHLNFEDQSGFGAAGGIAAGLTPFFTTELKIGSTYFFEKIDLKSKVDWADIVITGEGRYDAQSKSGKASYELLQLAKMLGKKIVLITSGNNGLDDGFDLVITLPDLDLSGSDIAHLAEENLKNAIRQSLSSNFWQ